MSVLIEGMEMPKEGFVEILIRDDGTVQQTGQSYRIDGTDYYTPYVGEMPVMYKATPVQEPHGRLINADVVIDLVMQYCPDDDGVCSKAGADLRELLDEIEDLPTIIPASEEG